MKKVSLFALLTLILGMVFSPPTNAMYVDSDDATWYTVEELLEYKTEVEQEFVSICGDDYDCWLENYYDRIEIDPKFQALEQMTQSQFIATSVNLGTETIKVLFFDEDMMLKQMGISEKLDIESVYIGWFESDYGRIFNFSERYEDYFHDEVEWAHALYTWDRTIGGANQITEFNNEVEIAVPGLATNHTGRLLFVIDSGPGKFNAAGAFIYESCEREQDYALGVECKLMYSAEKGQAYFPPRETTMEVQGVFSSFTWEDVEDSVVNELEVTNEGQGNNKEPESSVLKSPDTGVNTSPCRQKTIEFPWWLMILIALGDAAVLWLFWPKGKKTNKN